MVLERYVIFISTGIGNSSETDYIRGFTHYAKQNGYRVVVFNHVGALQDEELTGSRMFTYGMYCAMYSCINGAAICK